MKSSIQIILLSPQLWKNEYVASRRTPTESKFKKIKRLPRMPQLRRGSLTRFQILKNLAAFLEKKLVICNIGFPSRELYHILPQPSNFYMLGSLGMASPIGLGVAVHTPKPVIVIDGDGSLLSNLGSLATIAQVAPKNLTIFAIDNGVHGSTGNQPTATGSVTDLGECARKLGIDQVWRGSNAKQIDTIVSHLENGPNFVHIPAKPGNADVPIIPLSPLEIRRQFTTAITAN